MSASHIMAIMVILLLLGYPYLLLVLANKERGIIKISGFILSALFTVATLVSFILWQIGTVRVPSVNRGAPQQQVSPPLPPSVQEHIIGKMYEREEVIDEFINKLKSKPGLYDKFKKKLNP